MTVTTGSGDYAALMGAILTHAVTDSWTTTGGDWPISKGNVRGVDWTTFTQSEADFTLFGGASKTARYVRIGIGTTPGGATTNAALDSACHVPNCEYSFTSWTIYSDPSLCDYIHVVAQFSNGVNGDCYMHFGFGELDKKGMGHTAVTYATCHAKRGYSAATQDGSGAGDWNGGLYGSAPHGFTGSLRYIFSDQTNVNPSSFIIDGTVTPVFVGWPLVDTVLDPKDVMDTLSYGSGGTDTITTEGNRDTSNASWGPATHAAFMDPQPYSGAVTLGPLGFWLHQNRGISGLIMYLGDFPNIRSCSMRTFNPGDLVTYSSDNWNLWPMLRVSDEADLQVLHHVGSGSAGFAHKRVI